MGLSTPAAPGLLMPDPTRAPGPDSCTSPLVAPTRPSGRTDEDDGRVVRARARIANALTVARAGRYASAERMLRDALGVLERRQRYAGAARAAAMLGELLRERGESERAGAALEQARLLFDAVQSDPADAARNPLTGSEHEDYLEARALLSRPPDAKPPAPEPGRQTGVALDRLAGDLATLLRASVPAAGRDALEQVCAALQQQTEARGVGVYRLGDPGAVLASAGDVERRLHETVRETVSRGRMAPLMVCGREYRTALPIADGDSAPGALVLRWTRAPEALDRLMLLARVAAAACEPELGERVRGAADAGSAGGPDALLGRSLEMASLRAAIARAAAAPYPVLIEGETGAGKELVARALHRGGPRHARVFCAVNCAALTDELFEAELFGHSRGAFTGAVTERAGLVEAADGGTLFLDEVGELSARAQAKLLRVIQDGEIRRLGENVVRKVDVQLVAATNRGLAAEVAAGRFRQDLLFRLAVVCLQVPPLRDRPGDVELLARHFWTRESERAGKRATLDAGTIESLVRYPWPGNVRELQNVVARLVVAAPRRGPVAPALLPAAVRERPADTRPTLADAREAFERDFVRAALRRNDGRPTAAARELGISRQGLAKLVKRLGIEGELP